MSDLPMDHPNREGGGAFVHPFEPTGFVLHPGSYRALVERYGKEDPLAAAVAEWMAWVRRYEYEDALGEGDEEQWEVFI